MNNPYSSQHPQQYAENSRSGRNDRWGPDENRSMQTGRDDNSSRGQNRSAWGQQTNRQENYGQQGGYGQSRHSQNFSGQGEYGREWQGGSNYDDYGYQGDEFNQREQEYSPYSGQGEPEYSPAFVPRRQQTIRAENQRTSQQSRGQQSQGWQQPWQQGRGQGYSGNQFGSHQFGRQQTYGDQQFGNEYDQAGHQLSSGQSTGAFGLQQDTPYRESTHRGKGPKGYTRTDERIREEICELLSDDFHIDASEITVEVKDGVVTLEGTVQERLLKHRVEDIADNVSGVKDVHNSLRVTRQTGQGNQQQGNEKSQEKLANKSH